MTYLGIEGYTEIVRDLMATVSEVRAAVDAMPGIEIVGEPIGPVLALRSDSIDLYAVGDVMDDRGWNLNRNTEPPGLHVMLSPAHGAVVGRLIEDLTDAVHDHGASRGKEIRYS